ncbi:MAG: hypothetical protein ACMUIU_01355 [bacterium]
MCKKNIQKILISAPLRLSIAGGGTDLPEFSKQYGAHIISTAISLRVTVHITNRNTHRMEEEYWYLFAKRNPGMSVQSVESPVSPGAGLGGSGSFVTCLLLAEKIIKNKLTDITPSKIGLEAYLWERELLKKPVGFQDPIAAAVGGCVEMITKPNGKITIRKRDDLSEAIDYMLKTQIIIADTLIRRTASNILTSLATHLKKSNPKDIKGIAQADEVVHILKNRDGVAFGKLLDRHWQRKRTLISEITLPKLDALIGAAKKAGASGSKVIGAGGGGFLMVSGHPKARENIENSLRAQGCKIVPLNVEQEGVRIEHFNFSNLKEETLCFSKSSMHR